MSSETHPQPEDREKRRKYTGIQGAASEIRENTREYGITKAERRGCFKTEGSGQVGEFFTRFCPSRSVVP